MTLGRLLLVLAAVWVACIVLGSALHVVRFLVGVALMATLIAFVAAWVTRLGRRR
ncbi:MAG: hypothetical protein JSR21_13505 [Proteobacteria bacterium]|nr:hypothetical protein [Pseudomonadota bacterium]